MAGRYPLKDFLRKMWERAGEADKNSETQQSAPTDDEDLPVAAKVLGQILSKSMRMAFKKARLDIENDDHRLLVLSTLAFAFYGRRGPGQPKRWTKRKYHRLLGRIARIKAEHPRASPNSFSDAASIIYK